MHVILGSGGSVSRPLATALADYTDHVRLASRTPHVLPQGMPGVTYAHVVCDLLDAESVRRAVDGCAVAYLTAGLAYDTEVWRRDWPRVVDNVLAACRAGDCRLAFFDNTYAYAKTGYARLTEDVPLEPPSAKGAVRKGVAETMLAAHARGDVAVTIARAADFYGPGIGNAALNLLVFDKLAAGKSAQWLGDPGLPHSFSYTPDAGRHFALLANDARAYGQAWHLPADPDVWTVRTWVERAASLLHVAPRLQVVPRWAWWALARIHGQVRELYDVRDQVLLPLRFDGAKFTEAFGVGATPNAEGLAAVLAGLGK